MTSKTVPTPSSHAGSAWDFAHAATRLEAANEITRYMASRAGVSQCRVLEVLKFTDQSWVLSARLGGDKVVIKRFFNEDRAHTVRSLKDELDRLEATFGNSDCQANRCLMTWPNDGIVVLSHAPGPRLDHKIASARGGSRTRLLTHAGRWLTTYPGDRRRVSTFGPGFWIKRSLARNHGGIETPDQSLLDNMITALRDQNERVKGCAVAQAASHGDYVGMNAHYHRGTIYGVDIQGECWVALAREAARFLVWLQIHDADRGTDRTHGLRSTDVRAFLSSDVLAPAEQSTTFPFFVGEQLYGRFVEDYQRTDIRANTRAAMEHYLSQHGK